MTPVSEEITAVSLIKGNEIKKVDINYLNLDIEHILKVEESLDITRSHLTCAGKRVVKHWEYSVYNNICVSVIKGFCGFCIFWVFIISGSNLLYNVKIPLECNVINENILQ